MSRIESMHILANIFSHLSNIENLIICHKIMQKKRFKELKYLFSKIFRYLLRFIRIKIIMHINNVSLLYTGIYIVQGV